MRWELENCVEQWRWEQWNSGGGNSGTVEVGIGKQSNWIGSELELPLIPSRHPFILVFNLLAVVFNIGVA